MSQDTKHPVPNSTRQAAIGLPRGLFSFLAWVGTHPGKGLRALLIVAVVVVSVVSSVFFLYRRILGTPELEINKEGTLTFTTAGLSQTHIYSLSASGTGSSDSPWCDTGINVKPEQHVVVRASGQINLSAHHMIDDAHSNVRTALGWTGPEGISLESRGLRPADRVRKSSNIDSLANWGQLLIWIIPNSESPGRSTTKFIPYPGPGKELPTKDLPREARIWLTVNDGWLDPSVVRNARDLYAFPLETDRTYYEGIGFGVLRGDVSFPREHPGAEAKIQKQRADFVALVNGLHSSMRLGPYVSRQEVPSEALRRIAEVGYLWKCLKWEDIAEDRYWNLWFDNNVGAYTVSFEIR